MTDAKILFWDIELTPNFGSFWSLFPERISLNMLDEPQRMLCFGARWYHKKTATVVDERVGNREMLEALWCHLDEADMVVSWNGQGFDTKHANTMFLRAGMRPPSPYKEIDLMRVVKARFKFASNKLDYVSQELGVGSKVATGGYELWRGVMSGDDKAWRKMRRYQKQDVDLLVELFDILKPWIKFPHPVSDGEGLCRACGSSDLERRGRALTLNGSYQRYRCRPCGSWSRGATRLPASDMRNV